MIFPQFLDPSMSACWLSQHTNLKRELEAGVFAKSARQQMVRPGCCMLFSERLMRLGFSLVARSFGEAVRINLLFLYPTRLTRLTSLSGYFRMHLNFAWMPKVGCKAARSYVNKKSGSLHAALAKMEAVLQGHGCLHGQLATYATCASRWVHRQSRTV